MHHQTLVSIVRLDGQDQIVKFQFVKVFWQIKLDSCALVMEHVLHLICAAVRYLGVVQDVKFHFVQESLPTIPMCVQKEVHVLEPIHVSVLLVSMDQIVKLCFLH